METISHKLSINPDIHNVYGFLILSEQNYLIGKLSKGKKEVNLKGNIDIKVKKGRGGCSAIRFRRIRAERAFKSFKTIEENLKNIFIKDNLLNICGLIIAGKIELINKYLSFRKNHGDHIVILNEYISTLIEIKNSGELGFDEAIALSMIND